MMQRAITAMAMAAMLVGPLASTSSAQVSVNIGINLPGPPQLVAIPSSPVRYAVNADANFFFYGGEYYVFSDGIWYVSPAYNGPWVVLAPEFIPQPILFVPVQFYRRPPPAWRAWRHDAAPRWEPRFGQRWQERREEGQASPRMEPRRDEPRRDEQRLERREDRREERRDDRRDDRREERRDDRRDRR